MPDDVTVHSGEVFVIMRRMEALKGAIDQATSVPDEKMAVLQFHYDQVHRALTKAFDLRDREKEGHENPHRVRP